LTIFIDASAFVAIIRREPGATDLALAVDADPALGRPPARGIAEGLAEVTRYCAALDIVVVPFEADEAREAVDAHQRYGKGTGHPARLNMGDCFAYACAKTNAARLLYKGDDFIHTDLA
jgi:ribonuclease VapC